MLTKLLPEQTPNFWPLIEVGLREALPDSAKKSPEFWTAIMDALRSDVLSCWMYYQESDNEPIGFGITQILFSPFGESNTLLIYAIYGWESAPAKVWLDSYSTLRDYCKIARCGKITAFTDHETVVGLASKFGATFRKYIELEV